MNTWVISSNPQTYDAASSLLENGEIDWMTKNKFAVGDVVYIYEVIPPRGRGGIVYKTEIIKTNIQPNEKIDDLQFWAGQVYPKNLSEQTFSRLKLIGTPRNDVLSLKILQGRGFTPPQGSAYLLNKNPVLNFIESQW